MIKPMIAAEETGSNFEDAVKELENILDSRLQNVILHKDIDSRKNSRFFLEELPIKIQMIFYLDLSFENENKLTPVKIKFPRSSDRIFSLKEVVNKTIEKYSKNGWDKRLEIIYEEDDIKKRIFNPLFFKNIEMTLRQGNLEEKNYTLTLGFLKYLIVKGTVE
jgi:hypothetical protein